MKNKTVSIIIALVLIVGSFYAGMTYGQSGSAGAQSAQNASGGQFAGGNGGAGRGGRPGGSGTSGLTAGDILSKDSTGITVKLRAGGSQIVFVSDATTITKSVSGSAGDLAVGQSVVVSGTPNSDGSLNAASIQVRPAGETGGPFGRSAPSSQGTTQPQQ